MEEYLGKPFYIVKDKPSLGIKHGQQAVCDDFQCNGIDQVKLLNPGDWKVDYYWFDLNEVQPVRKEVAIEPVSC